MGNQGRQPRVSYITLVFHRILDFKPGLHFHAGTFLLAIKKPATNCNRVKIICDGS
jgi:hypothetical protein